MESGTSGGQQPASCDQSAASHQSAKTSSVWPGEKMTSPYEALFDSGYSTGTTAMSVHSATNLFQSQTSVTDELESDFHDKLSLTNAPTLPSTTITTDSGLCLDSGLSLNSSSNSVPFTATKSVRKCSIADRIRANLCNPFKQDEDGDTLLHLVISKGLVDAADVIIRFATHPDRLDIYNHLLQTALHIAALTGLANVVRHLVAAGATLDARNRRGDSALHIACQNGDLDVAKAILKPLGPADFKQFQPKHYSIVQNQSSLQLSSLIDLANYEGQTCMHLAGKSGNKSLIEYLLMNGGSINAREGKSGRTLLHWAVAAQKVDLVQFLLRAGTGCNVNSKSYAGHTPLDLAWALFTAMPSNARVRCLIVALLEKGGEPRRDTTSANDSSSNDSDSMSEEDSDEDINSTMAL